MKMKPIYIWLTGLPSSGKTTIAQHLTERLKIDNYLVYHLDGDIIRKGINSDLGFTEIDRTENIRRAAHIAKLMCDAGFFCCMFFHYSFKCA